MPTELSKRNILPLVKLSARFRVPPPVMVILASAGITSVSVTSMVPVTVIVRIPPFPSCVFSSLKVPAESAHAAVGSKLTASTSAMAMLTSRFFHIILPSSLCCSLSAFCGASRRRSSSRSIPASALIAAKCVPPDLKCKRGRLPPPRFQYFPVQPPSHCRGRRPRHPSFCRAGPMCPAAGYRICPGGAHGPRPTGHVFS